MSDHLHEALVYKAHRLHPIPFHPQSKTPAFATGEIFAFREHPASTAQLKAWFADPARNIGLITGAGGLVVLDVDGDEGRQSLKGLALPSTPTVRTKRGFHAYFRADRPLPTRLKGLPGVDLLADEWQVLAPSSIHPDRHVYAWEPGQTLANLALAAPTPWMLELAHAPPPDPDTPETPNQLGVPGAIAGKFTVSGSTEKTRSMVIPIFVSKNDVFEAYCCT
jgi:Bifunctional DNA primase/polymerase, N-terminal